MRSSEIKATAKEALKGNWFIAIIASFIASIFGASTMNSFSFSLNFDFSDTTIPEENGSDAVATAFNMIAENGDYQQAWAVLSALILAFATSMMIYGIIMMTVGSVVSIGYSQFHLDIIDGAEAKIGTLFARFGQIKTAICAKLLAFIYVFLGLLLFIVPGISMSFSYAMINFVMAENPDMNAREALCESKRIMRGHKWKLFCLECSFIIPAFLCLFTLGIGFIWLTPYINASYAAFYRMAKDEADFG